MKTKLSEYLKFVLIAIAFIAECFPNNSLAQNRTELEKDLSSALPIDTVILKTLTETEKLDFKEKAQKKTKELSNYISLIGNKENSSADKNLAISKAVKLFLSDSNIVQVSSINDSLPPRNIKIRTYLNRVKNLNYEKVTIVWYNINFVSDFHKRPDGNYEGIVTVFQKFEGRVGENFTYRDVTKKDVQIILKRFEDPVEKNIKWEVSLGDIKVEQTQKL